MGKANRHIERVNREKRDEQEREQEREREQGKTSKSQSMIEGEREHEVLFFFKHHINIISKLKDYIRKRRN